METGYNTPENVALVGFSHIDALIRAYQKRVVDGVRTFGMDYINFNISDRHKPFITVVEGTFVYNRSIEEDMKALLARLKPRIIFVFLWANHHFLFSTVNDPRRFDFILPTEPDREFEEAAEIVPYDLIRAYMAERCAAYVGMIAFFRSFTSLPIYSLSAPPPIANVLDIKGGSRIEEIDKKVKELGVAPASRRYKFWKLCEQIFRTGCEAQGVKLLPVPPETVDSEGFRLPEFFSVDWLHASDSYGELVLRQFDCILAQGAK